MSSPRTSRACRRVLLGLLTGTLLAATTVVAPPATAAEGVEQERWAGIDRYRTAAAIATNAFDGPVDVAYVATGQGSADALAAVPAAARAGAPILLVTRDAVPAATKQALASLRPRALVVLGGTAAISDATLGQLSADSGAPTRRVAGVDRFETAAAVVRGAFTGSVDVAFLAPGSTFTEALAAGPAAAALDAPLLLLDASGVPSATTTELDRLDPERVYVVGSTASAAAAASQQAAAGRTVERLTGSDWTNMSIAVSAEAFPGSDVVFVAQGDDYADALAGGAAAAALGAPLLLTKGVRSKGVCATTAFDAEVVRLGATRSIVLGGEGAVTDGAAGAAVCTPAVPVDVDTDLPSNHPDLLAVLAGLRAASTRGLAGPDRVHLIMYDDRERLAQAYSAETGAPIATSGQVWSSGEAVGFGGDTIFFNPSLARERRGEYPAFLFKVAAHEWFHLHQQTVGGSDSTWQSTTWIVEGGAEWFGWRVARDNGYGAVADSLRSAGPRCCRDTFRTVRDWETQDGFQGFMGAYEVSPLAIEHLFARFGSDRVDRQLWEAIGSGMSTRQAIQATFGVSLENISDAADAFIRSELGSA